MEKDYEAELEKRRELASLEPLAEGTEVRDPEASMAPEVIEITNLEELAKNYPTPEAFVEDFKKAVDQDQTKASPEDSALVQSVFDYVDKNPEIQQKYENGAIDKDILEELWKEVNATEPFRGLEKFRTAPELQKAQLTTKILKGLGDRETVSKEFITNMTNQGDVKQVEKELIRELLK